MKIARILVGTPDNQKGLFNNVVERTKHLKEVESDIDCYLIRIEYGLVLSLLKRQFRRPKCNEFSIVDGIKFRNLWVRMGLFDYFITHRLHRKITVGKNQLNKYITLFKGYDLLLSHGIPASFLSAQVKNKFLIPFIITWHGSDINVTPFNNEKITSEVARLLELADHNFFVSRRLLETSNKITIHGIKSLLYTGPSKLFYRYNCKIQKDRRQKYKIRTTYSVGFAGNFVAIKNVLILPFIFKAIQDRVSDVSFVVVGNGKLEGKLAYEFSKQGVRNLYMLGKQGPNNMPDIMNCLDVLVLPSLNEGLSVVTLEAQACGVHVVGSNRGGIPESIGDKNCFELDDNFVKNISARIIELLIGNAKRPSLPEKFSWAKAIETELAVYKDLLSE